MDEDIAERIEAGFERAERVADGSRMMRVIGGSLATVAGAATEITTNDGTGWGRDYGDLWEHVIAHTDDGRIEFFYMSDVEALIDPDTRTILASQEPAPGET